MTWIKVKLGWYGEDNVLEIDYTTFKTGLLLRELSDRIILTEGDGITREMPLDAFDDYFISVFSMLDYEHRKRLFSNMEEVAFR